jgi:hypothetical protein
MNNFGAKIVNLSETTKRFPKIICTFADAYSKDDDEH